VGNVLPEAESRKRPPISICRGVATKPATRGSRLKDVATDMFVPPIGMVQPDARTTPSLRLAARSVLDENQSGSLRITLVWLTAPQRDRKGRDAGTATQSCVWNKELYSGLILGAKEVYSGATGSTEEVFSLVARPESDCVDQPEYMVAHICLRVGLSRRAGIGCFAARIRGLHHLQVAAEE